MCDLSVDERHAILARLAALDALMTRIHASAASITERDWIDHQEMAILLADLATSATDARSWVDHKVAATHH